LRGGERDRDRDREEAERESESLSLSEPDDEPEEEDETERSRALRSAAAFSARMRSRSSRMRAAVPFLQGERSARSATRRLPRRERGPTHLGRNSSGTSTDGRSRVVDALPDSSCCVRDGRAL
jgi:hypothetical protein